MFGFSIQKLLFTVLAVAAIWYGFRWLGQVQAQRRELAKQQARRMKSEAGKAQAGGRAPEVEDMVECETCGAFVAAAGPRNCGRSECPYPD